MPDGKFDFGRNIRSEARQPGRFLVQNGRGRFDGRLTLKGTLPGHEFIQDTAQGKKVAAGIDRQATELFGRHIPHRAHHGARIRLGSDVRCGVEVPGRRGFNQRQAEVENFRPAVRGQKKIIWFDIPMDDAFGVGRGQTLGHGRTNLKRLAPRHRSGGETATQGYAFQQFRYGKGDPSHPANIMEDQDVWMVEDCDRLGLPLEAGQAIRVLGQLLRQDFDGDFAVEAEVFGTIDLAHASSPQRGNYLVRAESGSDS